MQALIEKVLCQINTTTDKNCKFLNICEMNLTANVADFKLLPKLLQRHGKIRYMYDYFI